MRSTTPADVSVLVPAYNAERFLARALESILAQSLQAREVIVVDDGSTDGTAAVAQGFGEPVRCVYQEHAGAAAARNRGIREATGTWVAFLDADDEWLPPHLQTAMGMLGEHPQLRWFVGAYERRTPDGRVLRRKRDRVCRRLLSGRSVIEDYFGPAAVGDFCSTITMVIHRRVFEKVGTFEPTLAVGEDLDMWCRIGLEYPALGCSDRVTAVYWQRAESLTGSIVGRADNLLRMVGRQQGIAERLGTEAVRRYRPLMVRYLIWAVRNAISTGNRDALKTIAEEYGDTVPWVWRLVIRAGRALPAGSRSVLGRLATMRQGSIRAETTSGSPGRDAQRRRQRGGTE